MTRHDDWGLADGWWATDGTWHEPSPRTRDTLHRALGASGAAPSTPPTWFVVRGERHRLWSPAQVVLEDGTTVTGVHDLPPDLPLGAHRLVPDDGGPTTSLFVVPPRAPRPPRGWGWSTQLYATRSSTSWGHGDLADLAELARWSSASGASVCAHNPLGAPLPTDHVQVSPYFASTRRFWSPLYLCVEQVDGAAELGGELEAAAAAGRALCSDTMVDHDAVWALKRQALESIWQRRRDRPEVRAALDTRRADALAQQFAVFCALVERYGTGWPDWPAPLHHPGSADVTRAGEQLADRVAFHHWLQLELDRQLAVAATAGAGLMADLPVGFDPAGFDAWVDQDLLALDCSVGAPPDDFSPTGQDWGLPPYVPWRLRADGYRSWIDTLRRVLRHAAALRVDHVMGLFRLFWIPRGAEPRDGAYVHHHGSELLDLAVMEAVRAGATLVGEDLGTVEPEVRAALAERDVFGYRIGWFQDDPPEQWPGTTLASLTTHDLPTVAGIWTGQDALDRAAAGVPADPDGDALLLGRLCHLAGVAAPAAGGDDSPATLEQVLLGAHDALAGSGSDLAVATLEDAVGVTHRPNLPGTLDEHPNWRRALPVPIEQLDDAGAAAVAAVMRRGRRG